MNDKKVPMLERKLNEFDFVDEKSLVALTKQGILKVYQLISFEREQLAKLVKRDESILPKILDYRMRLMEMEDD